MNRMKVSVFKIIFDINECHIIRKTNKYIFTIYYLLFRLTFTWSFFLLCIIYTHLEPPDDLCKSLNLLFCKDLDINFIFKYFLYIISKTKSHKNYIYYYRIPGINPMPS